MLKYGVTVHRHSKIFFSVDPGFSKGGGGHKMIDACGLYEHTFLITKTNRWEVVKNSASQKGFFLLLFCAIFPLYAPHPYIHIW